MPPRTRKLFPTPDDAESAFYDAFERADLAAMMVVWAEDDDVVCVHPPGPRLTGLRGGARELDADLLGQREAHACA